jgi:smad nuclear-interacting protein 1
MEHEGGGDRGRHSRDRRRDDKDDRGDRSHRRHHRSRSRDRDRSPRRRVKDEEDSPPRRRKDYSPRERSLSPPPRRERDRKSEYRSSRDRNRHSPLRSRSPEGWGSHQQDVEFDRAHPPRPRTPPKPKERPNYGLSGLLAAATNMKNGTILKYNEPPEAKKSKGWRIYVFKDGKEVDVLSLDAQSSYLIGKDRMVWNSSIV